MARDDPQVLVAVLQMVLQTAAALELDRAQLLAAIGLDEAHVTDRDGYVPLSKLVRLGEQIADACPGVNVGLAALDYVRPSTLGVLGYVVSHGAHLADSLKAFARYQNLVSPAVRWQVRLGAVAQIRIDAAPPLQRLAFPLETQVGLWIAVGRSLTGRAWAPRRVQLCHQPRGPAEEFAERFGCAVEFGAPVNQLDLPAEVVALPIVGARPELQPSLARLAETLLEGNATPDDHTGRVRALLLEELPRGLTSKDAAARRLGISARTLARRLHEEGASFRELLEDVRQTLARAWLIDPDVAIHEVAYLLGYSEPSTFHRSFRRWTGQTPTAWRRQSAST
ncbi:MAG: AraC family transcriptional regulator [Deltaproteobacteria bacterium]|nr:AraC family transcriptional regulator [Deltaproteobacteria bacterium]